MHCPICAGLPADTVRATVGRMSQPTHADPQPWTVTASRVVVQDRWITLRADDCRTVEGAEIAPFYVLDYSDWVQVVALNGDDHLILVRQYWHGRGEVTLELPCGGIDAADRDPLAAGARELAEETGYAADHWRLIASLSPNPANQSNVMHVLLATDARRTRLPADDPRERIATMRMPVAEAVAAARDGRIVHGLAIAALALALTATGRWPS